jgi:hypothetical protein
LSEKKGWDEEEEVEECFHFVNILIKNKAQSIKNKVGIPFGDES